MKKLLNLGLLRRKVFFSFASCFKCRVPTDEVTMGAHHQSLLNDVSRPPRRPQELADLDTVIEWLRNCLEIALGSTCYHHRRQGSIRADIPVAL